MSIQERIIQYLEYKGISAYKFCKDLGFSMGYLDKRGAIGTDKYLKIIEYYDDLDSNWLIAGKGEMLKRDIQNITNTGGNNGINGNVNGGEVKISHNDFSEIIDLQKELNKRLETSQNQLSVSQEQINILLGILKNK